MDIPEWLDPYVSDYKMQVFNIAWLSPKVLRRFKGDFRIVANFFVKKRKDPNYIPKDRTEIEHVDELLKLMTALTGDQRYVEILNLEGGKIRNMCEVASRLENLGLQKGLAEGRAEGDLKRLIKQTCKKMKTSLSAEEIADDLAEDDITLIQKSFFLGLHISLLPHQSLTEPIFFSRKFVTFDANGQGGVVDA